MITAAVLALRRVIGFVERAAGIEPATLAWKARALPLCNARARFREVRTQLRASLAETRACLPWWAGQDLNLRIAFASRVYSPVPLTTRPPTHGADPL